MVVLRMFINKPIIVLSVYVTINVFLFVIVMDILNRCRL
jgi:hypothetical protein